MSFISRIPGIDVRTISREPYVFPGTGLAGVVDYGGTGPARIKGTGESLSSYLARQTAQAIPLPQQPPIPQQPIQESVTPSSGPIVLPALAILGIGILLLS